MPARIRNASRIAVLLTPLWTHVQLAFPAFRVHPVAHLDFWITVKGCLPQIGSSTDDGLVAFIRAA